ncbi:SAM-dependent methyltransferase, MidA family [Desulfuromusa kysingii]|uniref:SAM-dependent methyltransferase, MidA family n=2 Tax=Desulfuromusa kysingii TaxID=37625 RepID=A0A1H3WV27_9BACT|nr:SAM-dependent methyltransferase, MidA family [Desulfuromusa kysingii]
MLHLQQRIAASAASAIPFAEFMEQALYHPDYGYYTAERTRIGKRGDFFTSSSVHSGFGRLIARQVEQMWQILGQGPFVIAEPGAGEGHLCLDILDALAQESPELYAQLEYRIIEISQDNRQRQRQTLETHFQAGRVAWCELEDLQGMQGCIISNELIDAFPVHLIEKHAEGLREVYVVNGENGFTEELRPVSSHLIAQYFQQIGIEPALGNRCEVNLAAADWMRRVATTLGRGFVLTIDYGYLAEELYAPYRHAGTLLCYYQHQTNENPYQRVGFQDITAHVDFTTLQSIGRQCGLDVLYFGQQYQFLLGLGFLEMLMEMESRETDPQKALALRMNLKTLILPEGGMGETFKVLIQGKDVAAPELLCARRIQDITMPSRPF